MTTPNGKSDPTGAGAGARLAHVGIAVRANAEQAAFFKEVLGLGDAAVQDSDGARIQGFTAGDVLIELLEPETPNSPVAKFIERRGPGIHHLCFSVSDLDGALERCRKARIELVDEKPRMGAEGKRIAFLHPRSTGGILIELTER